MITEQRNRSQLVVGQLQIQQAGNVEHSLGNSFITQLVVVQSHKCQVGEAFEVVSNNKIIESTIVKFSIYICLLMHTVCVYMTVHQLSDNAWTVYLLWDVIYTVPVQEQLDKATGYTIGHLLQGVVSQIELHEALKVLEHVLSYVTVTELSRMSTTGIQRQASHALVFVCNAY